MVPADHNLYRERSHALAGLACLEGASASQIGTCFVNMTCVTNISSAEAMCWAWPTVCYAVHKNFTHKNLFLAFRKNFALQNFPLYGMSPHMSITITPTIALLVPYAL